MTVIASSTKFGGEMHETHISAGGYVILRSVLRQQNRVVMTATASEDAPGADRTYPDRDRLLREAHRVFEEVGGDVTLEKDWKGRDYVQTVFYDAWSNVRLVADLLAAALGLGKVHIDGPPSRHP